MFAQSFYVADTEGTVLGSHTRPRWVAAGAARAAPTCSDGQPVLTNRAEAFAWPAR